jgi:integrase
LNGIRAKRGQAPIKPEDPFLLSDLAILLLDCALRPDEAFRLMFQEVRDGAVHVLYGKTRNARRTIPLNERAADMLKARRIR